MPVFDDGQKATELPDSSVVETDVLIVGSGPAGGSAALLLSTLGIPNIMITKYRWTANTPRAHITNQRTMEVFRDVGIADQVLADATEHGLVGDTVFCTSIAGEEIGRIRTWGTGADREADYQLASPCLTVDIPQTYLEPILVKNATMRGTQAQFSTEYLSHVQDADGVSVSVVDRLTGHRYTIRAKYLIGADGARSKVAADIDLPLEGAMDIAGSMNITFKADIAEYVGHRPSVLYWVIQPGSNVGGIGAGLVRMVRPWNEWLVVWGFDIAQPPPVVNEAAAVEIVRSLLGMPELDVEITGTSLWGNNEMYATHLQKGRVFCAGDAIHRHPPSNGLGSNTSIQDSYNLAWKIAAVLKGQAGEALLDTYSAERAPVAERIVKRANRSGREFADLFHALGVTDAKTEEEMVERIEERKANTPAGEAKRAALVKAMEIKNYEFNAHGVELGQFYTSSAVVPDGVLPEPVRDPDLYYQVSTVPGSHLPHAWVGDHMHKHAMMDLAPYDRFTLITGVAGSDWESAADKIAHELGVPLETVVIGPGRDVTDLYFDWSRLREVTESGALLVRPDKHICWRADELAADPEDALRQALTAVLSR
ncbi:MULTISPECIES: FAD-dependent monooxygenase [unclassified Rhodococcus (in: high G+C Gram-positive bacteria)]|uniref:FAD-dependent oxidoreductase n=1 Tax=unclassified Rhodococcus (in: high G+C Gram-positive bacteria) TaxID=192944 RepID=UPI000B9BC040|nr:MULTISPECIES: FAD-dependent monooxygenase [unclassified Rhodococcus (in: high G+C Gram-positive bacteria)]OZE25131.1 phenol 2-monooxygenase [Rhodococcus sp. 05-2254-6]OZE34176.1 phenol 2-monooxygenase [Rhodococcus sp. 05-2254-4]OZE51374.1 phenol 2-monooxygenase [Rhodococcus sp. 05-2254-3]OZE53024.1 phenol 2-monooxygenase [Rhodococcus sp. 05-2254-2]